MFSKMSGYLQALLVRFECLPGSGDPCDCVSAFRSDMFEFDSRCKMTLGEDNDFARKEADADTMKRGGEVGYTKTQRRKQTGRQSLSTKHCGDWGDPLLLPTILPACTTSSPCAKACNVYVTMKNAQFS